MSDVKTADLETVARRIRALLSKTIENGATEAEALAAAAKARELMDQHRLTQSDCEIESEPCDDVWIDRPTASKLAAVDHCIGGINRYCGVKSWFHRRWDMNAQKTVRRIHMIGLKSDVEMARWLYSMIATTIKLEAERFVALNKGHDAAQTRRLSQSFQVGMAARISTRLHHMGREREPVAKTSNGTSLVVVKTAVVNSYFDKLDVKLRGSLRGMSAGSPSAYSAGRAAAERVNLSRPINAGTARRITG